MGWSRASEHGFRGARTGRRPHPGPAHLRRPDHGADHFGIARRAPLQIGRWAGPEPLSMVSAVRAQVAGPTRDQPIYAVRTMEQIISGSLAERRFRSEDGLVPSL